MKPAQTQNPPPGAQTPPVAPTSATERPSVELQGACKPSASAPILARLNPLALADTADVPAEIMVFPAGVHTIHATRAGKSVSATVSITSATAAAMQLALQAHSAGPQKPYFDFDHDDTAASAWPKGFRWETGTDGKPAGVYARVEWSASGQQAVLGKDYRSFSPAFFVDASTPARVTGAPINMGGLVNAPAFRAQAPIWAKDSPAASPTDNEQQQPTHTTMTAEEKKAADAAASQAAEANKAEAETTAIKAKNKELETENSALKARDAERRKADAKSKVDAAVARGAIPAKDEALQAKWRGLIEADPAHADLLDTLAGNNATRVITSAGEPIQAKDNAAESLRAYDAVKPEGKSKEALLAAAEKRAAIYAKAIAPLFKPGFALGPILAAHDLGTLGSELVLQRSLSMLKNTFPFLRAITTDFSAENANFNQTVITRLRGALNVNDYVDRKGYGANDAKTTDVPITINKHVGVPLSFSVNELASTSRDLFGEQAEGMHYALGTSFVNALLALVTPANFANASAAKLSAFGRSTMTSLAKELNKIGVSPLNRFALLNPDFFEKLGQDAALVQLAAFQKPEYITDYRLPPVAGFTPYEATTLPAANALAGFVGTSESLALATRVPNDYTKAIPGASGGGVVSTVTNPDTGISVQLVQYIDHDTAVATARVALMYGVAVGNKDTGRRLTQAAEV